MCLLITEYISDVNPLIFFLTRRRDDECCTIANGLNSHGLTGDPFLSSAAFWSPFDECSPVSLRGNITDNMLAEGSAARCYPEGNKLLWEFPSISHACSCKIWLAYARTNNVCLLCINLNIWILLLVCCSLNQNQKFHSRSATHSNP